MMQGDQHINFGPGGPLLMGDQILHDRLLFSLACGRYQTLLQTHKFQCLHYSSAHPRNTFGSLIIESMHTDEQQFTTTKDKMARFRATLTCRMSHSVKERNSFLRHVKSMDFRYTGVTTVKSVTVGLEPI